MHYFYIFSKLTTSLVLILIIIFMGYALFKSYQGVDNVAINLESRFNSLSEMVLQNNKNYLNLGKKINQTENKISEIKDILTDSQSIINQSEYQKDIDNLININKKLENKINQVTKKLETIDYNNLNPQNNLDDQINSLIDIIFFKFKNGDNVKNEISYLENLLPNNKKESFEKLYLIEFKKFYGLKNLHNEFNVSAKKYINQNFLENDNNYVLNFLFKFVTIRPNDLNVFENEELNILMRAKKLMGKEDIKNALSQIMRIDKNQKIFLKWINQANIYLEFKNEIGKVI